MALFAEEKLINHAHNSDDSSDNCTNACEEGNPALSILLRDFHMKRTHFVNEENTRKSSIRTRIDVPKMFSNAVLIRHQRGSIDESIPRRDDLLQRKRVRNEKRALRRLPASELTCR